MRAPFRHFILDVDGVMTTGKFIYTQDGKVAKEFGPHDADGLKLIRNMINIQFISADKRGYEITKKRIVEDMGYPLTYVTEEERYEFVKSFGFESTVFMGDGIYDAPVLKACALGICPNNARIEAVAASNFVTRTKSAEGAVLDACLYIKSLMESDDDVENVVHSRSAFRTQ
jgi:3-deoxy-D-manno-octulosonate 8-phosphate phosphatase (KDO 8-P phosphatase)